MTCVIFVDDLNMPAKETYGAQPPIEILRQWMDHGGWYDRKENTFRQLVDVQFVAAMGPPGGGRTSITQRYVRHFNLLNFVPFSNESLQRVFGTILEWFLQRGFNSAVKQVNAFCGRLLPREYPSLYFINIFSLLDGLDSKAKIVVRIFTVLAHLMSGCLEHGGSHTRHLQHDRRQPAADTRKEPLHV